MKYRVGIGFDAHRLAPGRRLLLGGVEIPHSRGLEGHSDGDVLLHALCDALLGAVAAPDIGALFPPIDRRWRDAPSRIFVERAAQVVREKGYQVVQVDAVIIAEEPPLADHFEPIRRHIARVLGIPGEAVGVKATTCDGMGFSGRREGIAAQAIAMVRRAARAARSRRRGAGLAAARSTPRKRKRARRAATRRSRRR